MNGSGPMTNRFLSWPYHGAPDDEEQDAHEALERAAESFLPQPPPAPRRRGRPRRLPGPPREGT